MGNREFVEWIEGELEKRKWRPADLARAAALYPATISKVLNEDRQAGPDVCLALARAFKLPPELVFRKAGLLPELPGGNHDVELQQLIDLMQRMTPDERREILEYALWRYRRERD